MIALVTGATGFLGRQVVRALGSQGIEVRCLVHTPGREQVLSEQQVDVHYGNVGDPAAIRAAFYDVDVVVHLVAVIRESRRVTFEGVNLKGTQNIVAAARVSGVKHFIQMSAIGAADTPRYSYLFSKWRAEQEVAASGLPYTILRASLLFGEGDDFINRLAGLVRAFPITPIAGSGRAVFQPIAVDEVARCIAATAGREDLMGRVIEIGGPQQLSYNKMVDIVVQTYETWRLRLHIPLPAMRLAVKLMEALMSSPPATTEQLRMLALHNVAEPDTVEQVFGFVPRPLQGNIEYIKGISRWEGLRIALGSLPSRIRDH